MDGKYNKRSIFMFMIVFFMCNIVLYTQCSITFHPDDFDIDEAVFQTNTDFPNFLIDARFVRKDPPNEVTYRKHGITFKEDQNTCLGTSGDMSHLITSFKEIFKKGCFSLNIKFFWIYNFKYKYLFKFGVINTSSNVYTSINVSFGTQTLKCNVIITNNSKAYVYLELQLSSKPPGNEKGTLVINCLNQDNKVYYDERDDATITIGSSEIYFANYVITVDVNNVEYFTEDGYPTCQTSKHKCVHGYSCKIPTSSTEGTCVPYASYISSITNNGNQINCSILSDVDETDCENNFYIDISQYDKIEATFQPPRSNRVTLGLWVFIPRLRDMNNIPLNIILENFIVLTIVKETNDRVLVYCVPNEKYHRNSVSVSQTTKSIEILDDKEKIKLSVPPQIESLANYTSVNGRWFYIQCAMSYEHEGFYLMNVMKGERELVTKDLQKELFYDIDTPIYNDVYFRYFYHKDERAHLYIKNAGKLNGEIYFRNLMIFSEYMPTDLYFYYYSNLPGRNSFPQRLHVIPFLGNENNAAFYNKLGRVNSNDLKNYVKSLPTNFKRLILSPTLNQWYANEILTVITNTASHCHSDPNNHCFNCNNDRWLNFDDYTCNPNCPNGYTTYPGNSLNKGYCNMKCEKHGLLPVCPQLNDDIETFPDLSCPDGNEHFYYQCFNPEKVPNYNLYYSSMFQSATIKLNFGTRNLISYFIEFWFYPDFFHYMNDYLISEKGESKNYLFYFNRASLYIDRFHQTYNAIMSGKKSFKELSSRNNNWKYIHPHEWNHIVFNVKWDEATSTTITLFTNNDPYDVIELGKANGQLKLEYIIFCHDYDSLNNKCIGTHPIYWASAFYKNLRVWNGIKNQPFVTLNYDYLYPNYSNRPDGIEMFLPLSTLFINKNKLKDPLTSSFNLQELPDLNQDPWYHQAINYSGTFDVTKGRYKYVVSSYRNQLVLEKCPINCARCWSSKKCYECIPGYFLFDHMCHLESDPSLPRYYLSPPETDEDTELKEDIDFIRGTVTFWVKPFGFKLTTPPHPLFGKEMISYSDDLTLYYQGDVVAGSDLGLSLLYEDSGLKKLATAQDFKEIFGQWTFISLAYWRPTVSEDILNYFPAMMKFEINSHSYEIKRTPAPAPPLTRTTIPDNLHINKFKISRNYFGLIAYLKWYKQYIIGALGYELNLSYTFPQLIQYGKTIFIAGTTSSNCITLTEDIENSSTLKYSCQIDQDERFKHIITDKSFNYLELIEGIAKIDECSNTCWDRCYSKEQSTPNGNGGSSLYCSCRNINNNSQMILKNEGANYCKKFDYYNFANINEINVDNLKVTAKFTSQYTLQFWFWAYEYVNDINFKGFTIYWKHHMKITVVQTATASDYIITCFPLDNNITLFKEENTLIGEWVFISCSVDLTTEDETFNPKGQYFYLQRNANNPSQTEITNAGDFLTNLNSVDKSSLIITENNPDKEWGLLFFRQIRLWDTFFPKFSFLYRINIQSVHLFTGLIHTFDPTYKGEYPFTFQDLGNPNLNVSVTRKETYGMNVVDESKYQQLLLCKEEGQIFQPSPEHCITFLDMNEMDNFEFEGIVPSFTGQYSMGVWIFVEDIKEMTHTLSFSFQDHIKITINSIQTELHSYCYPQLYLINPDPDNVNYVTLQGGGGTWHWVLCSVSNYREIFTLNDDTMSLSPEILYENQRTDHPFRQYFTDGKRKTLTVSKPNKNKSKIYIRALYVFNDYIPYDYNIKYSDLGKLTDNILPQLLFSTNFEDITFNKEKGNAELTYYIYELKETLTKIAILTFNRATSFELSTNFDYIPLCGLNYYYDTSSHSCQKVLTCLTNNCIAASSPITCKAETNPFLDILSPTTTRCSIQCTQTGIFSYPGNTIEIGNICNIDTPPLTTLTSTVDVTCVDNNNHIMVGHKCYENTIIPNSAFYYSSCYSSPNLHADFSDSTSGINCSFDKDYIFEIWFMIDNNNFAQCITTKTSDIVVNKFYYLYTMPHRIYYNSNTMNFYYELPGVEKTISIFQNEWNKILIHSFTSEQTIEMYINYKLEIAKHSFTLPSSTSLSFTAIEFCTYPETKICSAFGANVNWGNAYYKNIRIWDSANASIDLISALGNGLFTENLKSNVRFWPMTADKIDRNIIEEIHLQCVLNGNIGDIEESEFKLNSNTFLYNFSSKFDWGVNYPKQYVAGVKDKKLTLVNCHSHCKRCYGQAVSECYECLEGFALKGTTCSTVSAYFVKLPTLSGGELSINPNVNNYLDNEGYTISFYIKFFGVLSSSSDTKVTIVDFRNDATPYLVISYDISSSDQPYLHMYNAKDSNKTMYKSDTFNKYIGLWIPIIIANFKSNEPNVYPHMFTLSVNRVDIAPYLNFNVGTSGIRITHIVFGNEISALIAHMRIYSRFIQGAYGVVTAVDAKEGLYSIIDLSSPTNSNCLKSTDVYGGSIPNVDCIGDYNEYLDPLLKCQMIEQYYDHSYASCRPCHSNCVTYCFGPSEYECTCDLTEGKYWLKRTTSQQTYCEFIPYIDFAYLNKIETESTIESSKTGEHTLEFWVHIYPYVSGTNFNGITLTWKYHNKVVLLPKGESKVQVNCFPFHTSNTYLDNEFSYQKWAYVQCGTDNNIKEYFLNLNENSLKSNTFLDNTSTNPLSMFTIELNTPDSGLPIKNAYGFIFLRQIKLWQQYNIKYILSGTVELNSLPSFFGLRAFFTSFYDGHLILKNKYTNTDIPLTRLLSNFKGYNYVLFDETVPYLCEEYRVIDSSGGSCIEQTNVKTCGIVGTKGCLTCETDGLYLKPSVTDPSIEDLCVSSCGEHYYEEKLIHQCRPCHYTCLLCNGKHYNNCLTCDKQFYYNMKEKTCEVTCEEKGLMSTVDPLTGENKCVPFEIAVDLKYPPDPKSNYINPKDFDHLEAELIGSSSSGNVFTEWIYDEAKSQEESDKLIYNCGTMPTETDVFQDTSEKSNLIITLNSNIFKEGCIYVFNIKMTIERGGESVEVISSWNFQMNASPYMGTLNIKPTVGLHNTTYFEIICEDWVDDNNDTLKYQISYREIINPGDLPGNSEIISDWSYLNDALTQIKINNINKDFVMVDITCRVQDSYESQSEIFQSIKIYNSLNTGYSVEESLQTMTLIEGIQDDKLLSSRITVLQSLAFDSYKENKPLHTISTFVPDEETSEIILKDPTCNPYYCNYFGECILIDTYMICRCDNNHSGKNCHIDKNGYVNLKTTYQSTMMNLMRSLNQGLNNDRLYMMHNIFHGASLFIKEDSFFTDYLPSFFQLIKNSPSLLVQNFNHCISIYGYYYDFLIRNLLNTKAQIQLEQNSNNRTILLPENQIEKFQVQITSVINDIETLMMLTVSYLRTNKREFIYENEYFYIALTQISASFNEDNFFKNKKDNYKPYIKFMKCMNYIEKEKNKNPFYTNWFGYLEFYSYPFIYDANEYYNNTFPLISFFIANPSTGKVTYIKDCFGDNSIFLYFPFNSYVKLDLFNLQKHLYDPVNYKGDGNEVFNDHYYINESGYVTRDSIEERVEKYHRKYNITCNYFSATMGKWDLEGVDFLNYTEKNYYLVCNSSHTTRFSGFFKDNSISYGSSSRFYYLFRTRLLKWYGNYFENLGFWIFVIVFAFHLCLIIVFSIIDGRYFKNEGMLEFLKREIVKCHYQYSPKSLQELINLIPSGLEFNKEERRPKESKGEGNEIIDIKMIERRDIKSRSIKQKMEEDIKKDIKNEEKMIKEEKMINEVSMTNEIKVVKRVKMNTEKRKSKTGGSIKAYFQEDNGEGEDIKGNPPKNTKRYFEENDDDKTEKYNSSNNSFATKTNYRINNISNEKESNKLVRDTSKLNPKPTFIQHENDESFTKEIIPTDSIEKDNFIRDDKAKQNQANLIKKAYYDLQVSVCQFLKLNIKERHKLLNIFFKVAVFHPRWKKVILLFTETILLMTINAILLTQTGTYITSSFTAPLIISLLSSLAALLVMYIFPLFFIVSSKKREELYTTVMIGGQLVVIKKWREMACKIIVYTIIGIILHIVIWGMAFYIIVTYTAVWKEQIGTWVFCIIASYIEVYIVCEILVELVVGTLFALRRKGAVFLEIGLWLNRMRNYRVLWP